MSKTKKAKLALAEVPETPEDIENFLRALTGKDREPLTAEQRKEIEAILAGKAD